MTNLRRSWSPIGIRTCLPQQQEYENNYLFSAVSPLTGEDFHLFLPKMTSDIMLIFLTKLKEQHPNRQVFVVVDNAPCHLRKDLHSIEGLTLIHLPPYSPELNPAERYFEEIRRATANQVFETLEKCEKVITKAIKKWTAEELKQLLGYKWITDQVIGVS